MKLEIDDKTIDFVFKMADVSGDGNINYDEFVGLFENLIKDDLRENQISEDTELDFNKQIMLKISEAITK
jgi:hypothetical protein